MKQLPREMQWWVYDLYCSLDWLFWKQLTEEECRPMFVSRLEKHLPQEQEAPIENIDIQNAYMKWYEDWKMR